MSMQSKPRDGRKTILPLLLFLPIACIYVVCFWQSASPMHVIQFPFDSSCFYVIGNGMLHGKMPYIDYIDNKGPLTYLVYALTARIGHFPWGVFFMGIACVFLSLWGIYALCRRLQIRHFYLLQILFLFMNALITTEGTYTEEMALPLCIWSFVVFADFYQANLIGDFRFRYGLLLGIIFWLCALTRFNNAVPIGAAIFCIGVRLLTQKEIKKAVTLVVSFIVGSFATVVPIVFWLIRHDALAECIDQVLLNNFKYSAAWDAMSKREIFLTYSKFSVCFYSILLFCLLFILLFGKPYKKENRFLSLSALFVTGVSVLSCLAYTQNFPHYLVGLLPAFLFCAVIAYKKDKSDIPEIRKRISASAIAALLVICFVFLNGFQTFRSAFWYAEDLGIGLLRLKEAEQPEWQSNFENLMRIIPEEEKDSVLPIDTSPKWLILSDIEPCERLFVCAPLFTTVSEEYAQEFERYFAADPPKWLLVKEPLAKLHLAPKDLPDRLSKQYSLANEAEISDQITLYLYRLEENVHE